MEKKVLIKDESRIGETIALLTQFAKSVEQNMNLLDLYNERTFLIDKKYIYEITMISDETSQKILQKYLNNINPLSCDNTNTNLKINNLKRILFTQKGYGIKNTDYPEMFEDLNPLIVKNDFCYICSEIVNKDSFNFDYQNNRVTIKEEIINYINEKNTKYLTSKNQIKAFEIFKNINSEIEKLKEIYNTKGDIIGNDIYYDIFKCYMSNNLFIPKEVNYYSVYGNIISKIKD